MRNPMTVERYAERMDISTKSVFIRAWVFYKDRITREQEKQVKG